MGIDGIKGPGAGSPPAHPDRTEGTGFGDALGSTVEGSEAPNGVSEALAKLQAGEIGVAEYLDLQVQDALSHLKGKLSPEQCEFVEHSLREQLRRDPVLLELVRRTTGSTPVE